MASRLTSRNLIVRTCSGNPVGVIFVNAGELEDLRSAVSANSLYGYSERKRLQRIYEGIKPEAEIEIESETKL